MSKNILQRNRNHNIIEEKYIVQIKQLINKSNYGKELFEIKKD